MLSEDKPTLVENLIIELEKNNINYWYDEAEILWGDSLFDKISEGISTSKYVIVILSKNFIKKRWPQKEMKSAFNIEIEKNEVKVLPVIFGSNADKKIILEKFPLLIDKSYIHQQSPLSKYSVNPFNAQ